jgi:hypothetical protein
MRWQTEFHPSSSLFPLHVMFVKTLRECSTKNKTIANVEIVSKDMEIITTGEAQEK